MLDKIFKKIFKKAKKNIEPTDVNIDYDPRESIESFKPRQRSRSASEITFLKEYKEEFAFHRQKVFAHRPGRRQRPRLPSKFTKDPNTTTPKMGYK